MFHVIVKKAKLHAIALIKPLAEHKGVHDRIDSDLDI
jgi:hypothetical protein